MTKSNDFMSNAVGISLFILVSTIYSVIEPVFYVTVMVVVFLGAFNQIFPRLDRFVAPLFALSFAVIVSLMASVDVEQSLAPSVYLVLILLISIYYSRIITTHVMLEKVLFFSILGFFVVGIRNLYVGEVGQFRSTGVAGQPNALGLLSSTGFILAFMYHYLYGSKGSLYKVGMVFLTGGLCAYWLYKSGSRGSLLATFFSLAYLALLDKKNRKYFLSAIAAIVVIAFTFFAGQITESATFSRLMALPSAIGIDLPGFQVERQYQSAADDVRLRIIQQALNGFYDSPVWGNGAGTFSVFSEFVYTHTAYFDIIFSFGLLGSFAYVWFIARIFVTGQLGRKLYNHEYFILKAKNMLLIFFLVAGMAIPNFQNKSQICVYVFLICFARLLAHEKSAAV